MEGRMSKYRQTSPERTRVWTVRSPKQQLQQVRKVPVVYYLCRNRHLEHPHFIEVPVSSPHGLYLRDFVDRLNVLRGKGMPTMYSWSCKRSYKNGFVWHDLCEDDMILPCHGNEFVLKGSELLEEPHSDRFHSGVNNAKLPQNPKQLQELPASSSRSQEASSSSSGIVGRETRSNPEDRFSPPLHHHHHHPPKSPSIMSPESGARKNPLPGISPTLTEYKVYKADGATDASTQTDDRGRTDRAPDTCTRGVSTDDELLGLETHGSHQNQIPQLKEKAELGSDEISPPPSSSSTSSSERKTETLESLIRAEATKMNSFRILEEEELCIPLNTKLKASNVLMQLISCGSISVKDHHSFGIVPTYKPRLTHAKFHSPFFSSSMMLGELDCLSENPRLMGLRLEDKEYFSGSLIETTKHKEEQGGGLASLKRSSSYNADRTCESSDSVVGKENDIDTARTKCIPRAIKAASSKHSNSRLETMRSPISDGARNSSAGADCSQSMSPCVSNGGSKRITDPSSRKRSSKRLGSKENEKLIKIDERLASGARVIIQSKASYDDSEGSLST